MISVVSHSHEQVDAGASVCVSGETNVHDELERRDVQLLKNRERNDNESSPEARKGTAHHSGRVQGKCLVRGELFGRASCDVDIRDVVKGLPCAVEGVHVVRARFQRATTDPRQQHLRRRWNNREPPTPAGSLTHSWKNTKTPILRANLDTKKLGTHSQYLVQVCERARMRVRVCTALREGHRPHLHPPSVLTALGWRSQRTR